MKMTIKTLLIMAGITALSVTTMASEVGTLTTFSDGNVLTAAELNDNNTAIITAVNDNNARVTTLEGAQPCLSDGTNCKKNGTLFTNWGRNDCPSGATVAYTGYIGGKSHDHSGSGSNLLCVTDNPSHPVDYNDSAQNQSILYGAEFETSGSGITSMAALHDGNPLCAVCVVDDASMQLMLPGATSCPTNWTNQYSGYLMSEHYTHSSSQFICVNENPIIRSGSGSTNNNGSLLYFTEAMCGSLPCAPYVQNREISCSVCTR